MSQDPFDEFEFKPITEGLGFHKKTQKSETPTPLPSLLSSPSVEMPLTQKRIPAPSPVKSSTPNSMTAPKHLETQVQVDDVLESLKNKRQKLNFEEKIAQPKTNPAPKVITYLASLPDFSAIILDTMLVVAGVLASLISVILTLKVDLLAWGQAMPQWELALSGYLLFSTVTTIYTLVTRLFMGHTAGEWVTDQVIQPTQGQSSFKFFTALLVRNISQILTGFIILPILSITFGKDFAGHLSGARLNKEKL